MARCTYCGRDMRRWWGKFRGCADETINMEFREYRRRHYGEEQYNWDRECFTIPCDDCGVYPGRLHHMGCEVEQCPIHSGQLFGCPYSHK
jgi:hypothetical protein